MVDRSRRLSAGVINAGLSKFDSGASAMSVKTMRPRKLRHKPSSARAQGTNAATPTSAATPTTHRRMIFKRNLVSSISRLRLVARRQGVAPRCELTGRAALNESIGLTRRRSHESFTLFLRDGCVHRRHRLRETHGGTVARRRGGK